MIERTYRKTIYQDGRIETFDPLFLWRFGSGMAEISIRNGWGIGAMWGWRIGYFSRYKTTFIEIGRLTVYLHRGMTKAHNPRTGEVYEK